LHDLNACDRTVADLHSFLTSNLVEVGGEWSAWAPAAFQGRAPTEKNVGWAPHLVWILSKTENPHEPCENETKNRRLSSPWLGHYTNYNLSLSQRVHFKTRRHILQYCVISVGSSRGTL